MNGDDPSALVPARYVDLRAPSASPVRLAFPLRIDESGRVVDENDAPLLVTGDAAWSMLVQLDDDGLDEYLATRSGQGFNTLLVNLIEHWFADDPPRNAFGEQPFEDEPFGNPVDAYFDRAHAAITRAAAHGFVVLLAPAYLGYEGHEEGWYADALDARPRAMYEYGRYVGARFADLPNVVWVAGGDFAPPADHLDLVEAVHDGIVDGGAAQLWTAHWSPEMSAIDVQVDWLDFNTTYTYAPVYMKSIEDHQRSGMALLLIESQYENDLWYHDWPRVRTQIYGGLLAGAFGSVYGHGAVWRFQPELWRESLNAPGAVAMANAGALFGTVPWTELVPDVTERAVVGDIGEFGSETLIVAAATPDRSLVLAYVPEQRSVHIDLGPLRGVVMARWFDPIGGNYVAAETELAGSVLTVEHPGPNATGDFDWLLRVDVEIDTAVQGQDDGY